MWNGKETVGIAYDEAQFFSQTGKSDATTRSDTCLHKILKKHKILDVVNTIISDGVSQ